MGMNQLLYYLGLSFCLILLTLGVAFGQGTVTKEQAAQQVQQATEAVKAYTTQQAQAFRKEAQEKLDDMSKKIDELKHKAAGAPADVAKKYESLAAELKTKADAVRQKVQGLGSVGSATWKDMKLGVEKAMDDLQKAYDEAVAGLK